MSAVTYETTTFEGVTIHVAKLAKSGVKIQGSVDGNKFGTSYDITVAAGFSDKTLLADGYTEAFAGNGSLFYTYDSAHYAEGVELVQGGVNNQDLSMSCVSNFVDVMAVGFLKDCGGIVIDTQQNITNNLDAYYSAITGAFGIMKDGAHAPWGYDARSSIYNTLSGRTILGQNNDYVFHVAFAGTTGSSGLNGDQLYTLCSNLGMVDALCFDGGGSVWQRIENIGYTVTTTRQVKNAWMIFYKEIGTEEPDPPITTNKVVKKIYLGTNLLWENQ